MAILTSPKMGAGHWYHADGRPQHTVENKKGDDVRATTLADARKLHLFPSVTSVLSIFSKPQLETWKMRQVAVAARSSDADARWAATTDDQESKNSYADQVIAASQQQVVDAADLGSKIHACLELALKGEEWNQELAVYVQPVLDWWQQVGIRPEALEKVLVNTEVGFAGCVDVLFRYGKNGKGILDYKTRKTKPGEKVTAYDGQDMQLAAYAGTYWGEEALKDVLAANIFISTTEPGRFEVVKHTNMPEAWQAFKAACALWQFQKKYDPRKS